jgi:hypothetical protein
MRDFKLGTNIRGVLKFRIFKLKCKYLNLNVDFSVSDCDSIHIITLHCTAAHNLSNPSESKCLTVIAQLHFSAESPSLFPLPKN